MFEPIEYSFVDRLFEKLDSEIVWLAEVRFNETRIQEGRADDTEAQP